MRTAEQYSSSQYEAISKCLDEFLQTKVIEIADGADKYIYQQVIFNEWRTRTRYDYFIPLLNSLMFYSAINGSIK